MVIDLKWLLVTLFRKPFSISFSAKHSNSWYNKDYTTFKNLVNEDYEFPIKDNYPCLYDKFDNAGIADSYYFIQDLFVAQKIYANKPRKHIDIASRIDGFVAHVASFREIEVFDIRKLDSEIKNVKFIQADIMNDALLPINYCDSISSLHALEHFGLGRYGDKIDPYGHLKGFKNITKMLEVGGLFYFSVPMGKQRVDFNAHRVFSLSYLMKWVSEEYHIESFSFVDDSGLFHANVELNEKAIKSSFGCDYGCAIFELRKQEKQNTNVTFDNHPNL